jgi:ADP-ribose pyrophosphatase YjhB (NUDIX family)
MGEFSKSYLGQLRMAVGHRLILVPGARLVLFRADGMILLQKRTDFGKWDLIGGSAEECESLTSMIVREAKEEAGIKIETPVAFAFSSKPKLETTTYPNGDRCHYFTIIYACDKFSGEPRNADGESTEVGWFELEKLPENCMPALHPTIVAFQRWRRSGNFQNMDVC